MTCIGFEGRPLDEGWLQAFLDGQMAPEQLLSVKAHLALCTDCTAQLNHLERRSLATSALLAELDPVPDRVPAPAQALDGFHATIQGVRPSRWTPVKRRYEDMRRVLLPQRASWRLALAGAATLVLLVAMFTIAPARQVLADFLGIFRVQKFAVISINQEQISQLEGLEGLVESGLFNEPEFLREPGPPKVVKDLAEAEVMAGFALRVPGELPEGTSLTEVAVQTGPHVRLTVDRKAAEAALAYLGITDINLPPLDQVTVEADIPAAVQLTYAVDNPYGQQDAQLSLLQVPSPMVQMPAGIDPQVMGELLLQVLGMPVQEARQVARSIDWTSTFIIPLPEKVGQSFELQADGVQAVLIEESPGSDGYRRHRVLLWERDGVIYALSGQDIAAPVLKQVADSLS